MRENQGKLKILNSDWRSSPQPLISYQTLLPSEPPDSLMIEEFMIALIPKLALDQDLTGLTIYY